MNQAPDKDKVYRGPLAGLNVIDFGHYYAGPLAAMLLADQGANVLRIVRPGEKELPTQQYRLLNRNKKILILDLKNSDDQAQALSLIEKADVLIENFRPGVMQRLGLDYASVKTINPKIVYASLPGFASTDKARAPIQAWEGILAAASGMYVDVSYVRKILNFPPVYHAIPVNSVFGAAHTAVAVMAALLCGERQSARENHRQGVFIETPLVDAGKTGFVHRFFMSHIYGSHTSRFMDVRQPNVEVKAKPWQEQQENWYSPGDTPARQSTKLFNAMQAFWDPLYRYYRCSDDRMIKLGSMASTLRNSRLLKTLGIYSQVLSEGFVNLPPEEVGDAPLDNNIANYPQMSASRKKRFSQLLEDAFLTKTSDEWDALLGTQLPFSKVRTRQEYLALQPMLDAGILTTQNNKQSALTVPGRFVDVDGPQDALLEGYEEMAAISSEEAQQLFAGADRPANQAGTNKPIKKGDLLKSIKVLDLGTWVAGPMSAYVLAQYGAEVIKLDAPTAPGLPGAVHFGLGKDSLLVDLHTSPGKEVLKRLLSQVDLVVHNKIDPVAERLGVTAQQLKAINPDLVVGQVSAFGGPKRSVWENRFGLDPFPQAATGLMAHYGSANEPHDFEGTMIADALAGFGLAFGSLSGLWQKHKTGYAGEVRASLIRAGNFIQLPYMIAENGNSDWGEARGQCTLGEHWWQRMYACNDGWIFLQTTEDRAPALLEGITGSTHGGAEELANVFKTQRCAHWLQYLNSLDIPCHQVLGIDDICNQGMRKVGNNATDEVATGAGEVIYWENPPNGYPVVLQAMDWVRVGEDHSWLCVKPTPLNGAHTREILQKSGYSAAEIDRLMDLGGVA